MTMEVLRRLGVSMGTLRGIWEPIWRLGSPIAGPKGAMRQTWRQDKVKLPPRWCYVGQVGAQDGQQMATLALSKRQRVIFNVGNLSNRSAHIGNL